MNNERNATYCSVLFTFALQSLWNQSIKIQMIVSLQVTYFEQN